MSYTLSEIQSVIDKTSREINRLEWEFSRFRFLLSKFKSTSAEDEINLEYLYREMHVIKKHKQALATKQRKYKDIARKIVNAKRIKPIDEARSRIAYTTSATKKGYFKMKDVAQVYVVFEMDDAFVCIAAESNGTDNNVHEKEVFVKAFNKFITNGMWKFVD